MGGLCREGHIWSKGLTETWVDKDIGDAEISIRGFQSYRRDRNRRGGGIMLYIRDDVSVSKPYSHADLELLSIDIKLHCQSPLILY